MGLIVQQNLASGRIGLAATRDSYCPTSNCQGRCGGPGHAPDLILGAWGQPSSVLTSLNAAEWLQCPGFVK